MPPYALPCRFPDCGKEKVRGAWGHTNGSYCPEPGGYFDIQQLTKAVYALMVVALEQNEQIAEL